MDKKFLIILGIIAAMAASLFLTVWIKSSKITIFEECEKAGWLVRSRAVFDFDTPIEKECVLWNGKRFVKQRETTATEALRSVLTIANELSGIKSGAVFNFEIIAPDSRFANFGITKYLDEVRGERIAEEHAVVFREIGEGASGEAEVDRNIFRVVSLHRQPVNFGGKQSSDELLAKAYQFLNKVIPDFTNLEPTLDHFSDKKGENYFFRWNDKKFALPKGLEMDLPPFIQVGIASDGFIFSYDNTIQLYSNLSKETLRKICGYIDEMPQSDDSLLDAAKGVVKVGFNDYSDPRDTNRYLLLPYEPETDFEGCSEPARAWLKHLPKPLN